MENNASEIENPFIHDLSRGPKQRVTTYHGYVVNGYRFHTVEHGSLKSTNNSGVCIKGSIYGEDELDYYGRLLEVMVVEYPGLHDKKVVLFKCEWFDPSPLGTLVHPNFKLVSINHTRRYTKYEPFVLATQACQVFYCPYPSKKANRKDYWEACKIKARPLVEVGVSSTLSQPFQEDALHEPHTPVLDEEPILNHSSAGILIEMPSSSSSSEEDGDAHEYEAMSSENEDSDSAQ